MAHQPNPTVQPLPHEPAADAGPPPAVATSAWDQPRDETGAYVQVERRELRALTSLRFFAALYVVVHHLVNVGLLHTRGADADRAATWYLAWATQGHVGVTFFFVLSGFILAWCYHRAFAERDETRRRASRRRFWVARVARVWPLHVAMFTLFVPLALLDVRSGAASLIETAWTGLLNVFLLHAWVPTGTRDGLADTFNAPSWTLSVEACFYLAFPLIATLLVGRLRWGVAQLALLAAASWLALGALGVALSGSDVGEWAMRVFPPARLPDFLIGVVLGLVVVQRHQRAALHGRATPTTANAHWTAVEAGVLALACLSPAAWALGAGELLPATLGTSWFHLPSIAAAILVLALERGAISRRLLALRPLVWLGEASYALYLVHLLIILGAYRAGLYDVLGVWLASGLIIAVSIVVAGVVHERFEQPMRARLSARWQR